MKEEIIHLNHDGPQKKNKIIEAENITITMRGRDTDIIGFYSAIELLKEYKKATHLKIKDIHMTKILFLNYWEELFLVLKTSNIKSFELSYSQLYQISDKQWNKFFTALKDSNIESFTLSLGIFFSAIDVEKIKGFFTELKDTKITTIKLFGSKLQDMSTEQLRVFLCCLKESNIKSFEISSDVFYKMSADNLEIFIEESKNIHLSSVDISNSIFHTMKVDDAKSLIISLKKINIMSVNISSIYISEDGFEIFSELLTGLRELPNLQSIALTSICNDEKGFKIFQELFTYLRELPYLQSIDLSNNDLNEMTHEQLKTFCDGLKELPNFISINLSGNNLEALDNNKWNQLIATLKQSKINKVNFGQDTIEKLSDKRKKNLANLHLTEIPLDRYKDMTILQFAAKVYGLKCNVPGNANESDNPNNAIIKKTWLVAELVQKNKLSRVNIDIVRSTILKYCAVSHRLFQLPIIACKESVDLINQIYNDNPQLRTINVAHSEYFMSPAEEFSKAIAVGASEKNDGEILAFILSEQQNISTAQLKSIAIIANKCNKQEILSEVTDIINLRSIIFKGLTSINKGVSAFIENICKKNNLEYEEDSGFISFVQEKLNEEDGMKVVAEIAQQISTRFQRSAVKEVQTSHADRVVEQRSASIPAGGRVAEL
jgi:hypothetical protein